MHNMSQSDRKYLYLLVFTTGAVTLGMELSASRLLEPAFGSNQIVWAALIGMILLYLAIGAWLGGKLADRFPRRRELDYTVTLAAIGVALAPAVSRPVLHMAIVGMEGLTVGLLAGSLLAMLLLFGIPGILLGTTSPWVVRLAVDDLDQTGRVAGRLYAIATAGSLVGTFIPVLWLIPTVGTRWDLFYPGPHVARRGHPRQRPSTPSLGAHTGLAWGVRSRLAHPAGFAHSRRLGYSLRKDHFPG